MKTSCEKCGKIFNMEEHLYICPKCNHYHSQIRHGRKRNVEQTKADVRDLFGGTQQKSENVLKEKLDKIKSIGNNFQNKKLSRIVPVIAVIIIVMLVGAGIAYNMLQDQDIPETDPVQIEEQEQGEVIEIIEDEEMYFDGATVSIGKSDAVSFKTLKDIDGWKYVQFDFSTVIEDNYEWDTSLYPYLKYDGVYYRALDSYNLIYDSSDDEQLVNEKLNYDLIYADDGIVIFIVPDEAKNAELYVKEENYDSDKNTTYIMPVEL